MAKNKKASDAEDATPDAESDTDALDSDSTPQRSAAADSFWEKVGVEPVEIAMPKGVGLTLRAYRMSDDFEEEEVEEGKDAESDDKDDKGGKESKSRSKDKDKGDKKSKSKDKDDKGSRDEAEDDGDEDDADDDVDVDDIDIEELAEEEAEEEAAEDTGPQEVPVFLTVDGTLPLFDTAEALVKFVKSGAGTDLATIDTWDELVKGIKTDYVVPSEDDQYELDLVVKNLRGGHDTWDPELMIGAGELARDLGFALRIPTVMSTLSAGSPLDELDNTLRSINAGGIRAIFARRKMKKVGTQQATLAWRGIINKIGETVDWRN